MFYGILIRMFFYDTDKYNIPHIHAEYQGQVAVYAIQDGTLLAGELPSKKHKLVVAHGLKFTKTTCSLIGNWLSTAKNHFPFEDSINENCRNCPQR